MNNGTQYQQEVEKAKAALAELRERGMHAIGGSWDDLEKEFFTPEEIATSDLRVAMMIELAHARKERGIPQKKL